MTLIQLFNVFIFNIALQYILRDMSGNLNSLAQTRMRIISEATLVTLIVFIISQLLGK